MDSSRPSKAAAADIDHRAAKRAFFRIMEAWDVSDADAQIILGKPSRSAYYTYKKGQGGPLSADALERISYVLGVYKALQLLFIQKEQADAWIKKPNQAFGGESALRRMLGGLVVDLAAVRGHLDSVRGGGA